ncbi:hypothetical protein HU200_013643 [Digitaria exilis]|uniref:Uncharacterized protein n=1 Tax=Digitaria exilis TaxID=1010633 RepID=A0A835FCU8_9POAL|nr:hypothetical protein HU200_013643 [Digitaria exilis]
MVQPLFVDDLRYREQELYKCVTFADVQSCEAYEQDFEYSPDLLEAEMEVRAGTTSHLTPEEGTAQLKIDHRHDVCLYEGNIMSLTNRTSSSQEPWRWRSLTYDRAFIAAHRACHPEPLLAYAHRDDNHAHSVDIVDLSGQLVKRVPVREDGICVLGTRLELVCVAYRYWPMALMVLNQATGAGVTLPECHSEYTGNGPETSASPLATTMWSGMHLVGSPPRESTRHHLLLPRGPRRTPLTPTAAMTECGGKCINLHPLSALNML